MRSSWLYGFLLVFSLCLGACTIHTEPQEPVLELDTIVFDEYAFSYVKADVITDSFYTKESVLPQVGRHRFRFLTQRPDEEYSLLDLDTLNRLAVRSEIRRHYGDSLEIKSVDTLLNLYVKHFVTKAGKETILRVDEVDFYQGNCRATFYSPSQGVLMCQGQGNIYRYYRKGDGTPPMVQELVSRLKDESTFLDCAGK